MPCKRHLLLCEGLLPVCPEPLRRQTVRSAHFNKPAETLQHSKNTASAAECFLLPEQ